MAAYESAVAETDPSPVKEFKSPPEISRSEGRQMEVGELSGHSLVLDSRTLGKEIWQIFKKTPDLPAIIFARESDYAGLISSTQFLKIMSRPFGREIFEGRPISLMLKELSSEALILNHNLGIQDAIEFCLNRPKDLIYEPFLVVNPEKNMVRVCTVQVLMHASSQAAILRNRQMEQILSTVTDGLLLVDRDFRIGSEHSKALEPMLGRKDLCGKLFTDLLTPLLSPLLLPQAVEYLQVLFDRKLIDRLIKGINPIREITVKIPTADDPGQTQVKHLTVDFERIYNRGEINQILVRIQDVTRKVNSATELQQREAAAENRMKLMLQIVTVEPGALKAFLAAGENEISKALESVRSSSVETIGPTLDSIFRAVHRLKGDAALLQLGIYKDLLHQFEDRLDHLRKTGPATKTLQPLESGLDEILSSVQEARSILEQFGKWNVEAPSISKSGLGLEGPRDTLIPRLEALIEEMGSRLGKKARLHAMIDEGQLPVSYAELLKDTLVQLVRNSLAHGIEIPTRRELLGKPATGILQIVLEKNPDSYEIIFQDDGAGLDREKIRRRAVDLGIPLMDEEALTHALFTPGFSTSDQITEDAGRGVGLDLIRTRITEKGGCINIHSEQDVYCAFQIFLPLIHGDLS